MIRDCDQRSDGLHRSALPLLSDPFVLFT